MTKTHNKTVVRKMMRIPKIRLLGWLLGGVLASLGVVSTPAQAEERLPLVISATVDYTHKTLTITGQNFGRSARVTLDSITFPTMSSSSSQIVADFPNSTPPSSFKPGTYFLTLQFKNQEPAIFTVDIGAAGVGLPATCASGDVAVFYKSAWTCKSALPRYVANGDGTVTDNLTGLMWEMQTSTCGGEVTCYATTYNWSLTGTLADGPLFTVFIAKLNGGDYYSPSAGQDVNNGPGSCFANHCDWRIPTVVELQSILLAPYPCGTSPCIDPAFGPTQASFYWSSSSLAGSIGDAWDVYFLTGGVGYSAKNFGYSARAVRSGR